MSKTREAKTDTIERLLPLFREYMGLEKKRMRQGVTPVEFRRWLDLKKILGKHFQAGPDDERRESLRLDTRLRVDFESEREFRNATIKNLSRGGVFVATPVPVEVGTELILHIEIQSSGKHLEIPGTVVTNNLGGSRGEAEAGMGIRFGSLSDEQRRELDLLYERAIDHVIDS